MQEQETIITGALPPKKRKFAAKIAWAVLLVAAVGAVAYLFISGRADGFAKKTLAIAAQSWSEVLGLTGNAPMVAEVDLNSDGSVAEDSSSTVDVGRSSSSAADVFAASRGRKKSTSKKMQGKSDDPHISGAADAYASSVLLGDDTAQSSSISLGDVAIIDPIVVADGGIDPSPSLSSSSDDGTAASSSDDDSGTASSSSSSSAVLSGKPPQCSFSGIATSTAVPRVMLNEIAWMGSPAAGETAAKAANHEWIELKNVTESAINLDHWQIADSAGNIDVTFGTGDELAPGAFLLLSRDGNPVRGISSDKAYSGGLSNSGEMLAVFDAGCDVSDVLDASAGWPGGDNITKQTLERKVGGIGWQTSLLPGGTPRAENSVGAPLNVSSTAASSSTYPVEVAIVGDGSGKVTSKPTGISCATAGSPTCTGNYASGTVLTLTATPGSEASFVGWTGQMLGSGNLLVFRRRYDVGRGAVPYDGFGGHGERQ